MFNRIFDPAEYRDTERPWRWFWIGLGAVLVLADLYTLSIHR